MEAQRRRPDDYNARVEKPFAWVDPGAYIAVECRRWLGNQLYIESTKPFRSPHILLSTCGAQEWTEEFSWNFTPSPQNYNFGNWLTVPWATSVINCADSDDAGAWDADAYSSEDESLDTPRCEYVDINVFELSDDEHAAPHDAMWQERVVLSDSEAIGKVHFDERDFPERPTSSCSFYDDDDEEGDLPPFDDWYQSIAERTRL